MAEHPRYHTKYLSQLSALYPMPEQKIEAAKTVASTMQTPGWELITHLLEDRMAQRLNDMVRHEPVRSEAEYAAALAEIRGIQSALDAGPTVLHVAEAAQKQIAREGSEHG